MSDFFYPVVTLLFVVAIVVGLVWLMRYLRLRTHVIVMEYERGVVFRKGLPFKDVGPGRYAIIREREFLVRIDVRPKTVSAEQQAVGMQDGRFAVYSLFASTSISDPRKAMYSARDYNEVPIYAVRRRSRSAIASQTAASLSIGVSGLTSMIAKEVSQDLQRTGMRLDEFKITRFEVRQLTSNEPKESSDSSPLN